MSELTDRIINDHLNQRPDARHAYQHDPTMHHQVEWARGLLSAVELAMRSESIPADVGERVLAEAVRAGFAGWEREKLRRERALLLATFDPSEFGRLPNPVFAEPAEDFSVMDELKPHAVPVHPGEEPTT